jgi:5-methyltetrahydrofolate--homocysteine methyltransferase
VLIGGATTSGLHTAVKLDPFYSGAVSHVLDASRVVEVCQRFLSENEAERVKAVQAVKESNLRTREEYLGKAASRKVLSAEAARARKFSCDWSKTDIAVPDRTGVFDWPVSVGELVEYIDWSPLFWSWELKGLYPKIFEHPKYGDQAKQLFADAKGFLDRIVRENRFHPRVLVGFFPAVTDGARNSFDSRPRRKSSRYHHIRAPA